VKNYTERLNLTFDPFEPGATSREFFADANRQQLLDQLIEHSLYSQSIMAVTGCLGSGKSTLAKAYCESFGEEAQCALIPATLFMNQTQFLEKLGEQIPVHLNDEETESAIGSIQRFAAQQDLEAKSLIIVVDDAHELSAEVLNLISSLLKDSSTSVHILMLGEVQLTSMLRNAFSAEKQSNLLEFELSELGGEDSIEYVRFKLAAAGYTGQLPLSGGELGKIHNLANGIPGTINALVANALEDSVEALPASEKLPAFVSRANAYWAVAAVLIVFLVSAVVIMDPESEVDEQQSIAAVDELVGQEAGSRRIEIPLAVENTPAVAALGTETGIESSPLSQTNSAINIAAIPETAVTVEDSEGAAPLQDLQDANAGEATIVDIEIPEIEIPAIAELTISDFEKSLLDSPSSSYTVQIMASHSETNVQQFVEEELDASQQGYFETRFQDKPWYVVVHGRFANRTDAAQAIEKLPDSLQALQPWVRTLADIQSDIRQLNSIN
jgi:DamX protein